ncbi:SDR family NAD(P)-dependent oxidoreductase [Pseudolabrys taiwanensis]|uniref:SDR family NAD(P)-dependent oxidoreductase n=1 Tax=Pseudolabrys taiwanensis TaxID=331696 RepID=A0A346A4L4_9HYPH|nr:SDR family oxidoreductase [Pseudolabrys taiwanensis]AXK84111.1 SDR family NAD(P)-dependent oxidoreductase [Pseudolabrys taiwanensis]
MKRFSNKVAVITGGNSGIGFAIAQALVAEGAEVVVVGRRADAVEAAVTALGGRATGLSGDVSDLATHDRVAALVAERFGGADIYVANAGINLIQASPEVRPMDFDAQFFTNARGTFFGVQKIVPMLRDGGAILLTSSIAARKVLAGHAVYAGSKAAVEAFARSWALELKDRRIRVNVLSPGPTATPIIKKLGVAADALPDFERQVAQTIPLGRLGEAEELARAAMFLLSADSTFVTGVNLAVDGGISLV